MSETWGRVPELLDAAHGDPEAAADALLDRLDRDEVVSMIAGQRRIGQELVDGVRGRYNAVPYPAGAIARLGFPGIRFADGPRGVVVGRSTAFPISMARGATFDPELEREIGDAIGAEATAQGANLFAGICVNLLRHPSWGRAQETYGEDTFLLGEMGAALTESVGRHMATCVKHYAVNSMENSRFFVDVRIDEADLADIYLPHFKRCIDAGADAVMSAYNKVNGEWAGHHHHLLTEVLKERWGFEGFVMSDFGLGIRDMVAALEGGQDLEMPMTLRARKVPAALADGRLDFTRVRDAARRIARSVLRAGQRSGCAVAPRAVVAGYEHRHLSKRAAIESFVLLRNEDVADEPALPLDPTVRAGSRTVALVGALAGERNTGDHGSSHVRSTRVTTVADGMRRAAVRHGLTLRESLTDDPDEGAASAAGADAAVVVVGSTWRDEGEFIGPVGGDRPSLTLHPRHEALIEEAAAQCPRTIVVLVGGSAFVTERWRRQVPGILMTWYSGDEGGSAIAEVVMGDASPGGRLPCTWPASARQLPPYQRWTRRITYGPLHGYRLFHATGRRPAFWFGAGLSYSAFEWGVPDLTTGVDGATVAVAVTNTGERTDREVVQAYLDVALGTHPTPLPTLAGFAGVALAPGETREVAVALDGELCARATGRVDATVWVGRSADPDDLIRCGTL